jgi:hypothetical protein
MPIFTENYKIEMKKWTFFIFLLKQRFEKRILSNNSSFQKQKKKFLTVWGSFIVCLTIILTITYHVNYSFFWILLIAQSLFLLSVFFMNFRLFFPKKGKSIEKFPAFE